MARARARLENVERSGASSRDARERLGRATVRRDEILAAREIAWCVLEDQLAEIAALFGKSAADLVRSIETVAADSPEIEEPEFRRIVLLKLLNSCDAEIAKTSKEPDIVRVSSAVDAFRACGTAVALHRAARVAVEEGIDLALYDAALPTQRIRDMLHLLRGFSGIEIRPDVHRNRIEIRGLRLRYVFVAGQPSDLPLISIV